MHQAGALQGLDGPVDVIQLTEVGIAAGDLTSQLLNGQLLGVLQEQDAQHCCLGSVVSLACPLPVHGAPDDMPGSTDRSNKAHPTLRGLQVRQVLAARLGPYF
jgi:hypothetical protein